MSRNQKKHPFHPLRTQLTISRLYGELVLGEKLGPLAAAQKKALRKMIASLEKIERIITRFESKGK